MVVCLTNTESKISFSDWPALDIDFSNKISAQRGRQEAEPSCLLFQTCALNISRFPQRRRKLITARTRQQSRR